MRTGVSMDKGMKLQIKDLTRVYEGNNGKVTAISGVNLEVRES